MNQSVGSIPDAAAGEAFEKEVARQIDLAGLSGALLLAGVSGGADSVALLLALLAAGCKVIAVHVNFNLRGAESRRDEAFVRSICPRLGVELYVESVDTKEYCRSRHLGLEAGCREIRYNLFRRLAAEKSCSRIAVAHHSDDNAETFLLSLMRGAGLRGLKSMTPDNGEILRPLLGFSRREIENYLAAKGEAYVVDSSNLTDDFNRNYLRHRILPALDERWPSARRSIAGTLANLRGDYALLAELLNPIVAAPSLPYAILGRLSRDAAESLLFHFIEPRGGSPTQAREMASSLPAPRVGAVWHLGDCDCVAGRDAFELVTAAETDAVGMSVERISFTDDVAAEIKKFDGNNTLWLADAPEAYRLRLRRDGDRIAPLGMKGTSLVSDIVKDAHLSAAASSRVYLLEHIPTSEIIWIPGLKRSRHRLINLSNPPATVWRVCLREK